mmetsp:Transcript_21208/g.44613  ORF Transcript_21208/g.44613 Transcript_21208/m.44613 type:complete len:144 (-) Transcript_21208:1090-1521(-)
MKVDCEFYSVRRSRCHGVYSNRGEECLHEELAEKRCLSAQRCPRQALEYYGTSEHLHNNNNNEDGSNRGTGIEGFTGNGGYQKALCASWAESFAYADKELEHGEEVARHHREARRIVSNDAKLRKECRQIAMKLAECLRATKW